MDITTRLRGLAAREITGEIPVFEYSMAADEIDRLRLALQPFADVGGWLFARSQVPDDTPLIELRGINGSTGALTRGDFKAASAALTPNV